jgi:hypothetical protein
MNKCPVRFRGLEIYRSDFYSKRSVKNGVSLCEVQSLALRKPQKIAALDPNKDPNNAPIEFELKF